MVNFRNGWIIARILFTISGFRLERAMRPAEQPAQPKCDSDGGVRPILDRTANDILERGRRLSYAFGRIARSVFGLPVLDSAKSAA